MPRLELFEIHLCLKYIDRHGKVTERNKMMTGWCSLNSGEISQSTRWYSALRTGRVSSSLVPELTEFQPFLRQRTLWLPMFVLCIPAQGEERLELDSAMKATELHKPGWGWLGVWEIYPLHAHTGLPLSLMPATCSGEAGYVSKVYIPSAELILIYWADSTLGP